MRPAFLAGYSFGVYAAFFASGAVSFADGLAMMDAAYQLMAAQCHGRRFGMGVVLGLRESELAELAAAPEFLDVRQVNANNDACGIFSGPREALARFLGAAKSRDALSAEMLDVAIPYHHPLFLADVSPRFHQFISGLAWREPATPLVSSVDQELLTSAAQLRDFAARNLSSPISWRKVVARLQAGGVGRIVECGPGVSLTQNGRFLDPPLRYLNLKNLPRQAFA